jgi:hypothetical protein
MSTILEYVGHTAVFDNLPQLSIGVFNSMIVTVTNNSDTLWGFWVSLMAFILAIGFLYLLWKLPYKFAYYIASLI